MQATKKWGQAYWQNVTGSNDFHGGKNFSVNKWISEYDEYWAFYRVVPVKLNGKATNVLFYFNGYTYADYYSSKALAKKYQKKTGSARFS